MYVTDMDVVRRLHDFAAQGGTVVMTTRSGVKDQYNNAIMAQLPTVYRDMVGAHAEEYSAIGGDSVQVKFADGTVVKGWQWCDILQTDGAEVLAVYDSEYFRGTPAITRNVYGEGAVYYIATVGEQALYNKLIRSVVTEAGLSFIPDLPPHVEVTTRTGNGRSTRFIFNNTNVTQVVRIDGKTLTLPPFDMHIDCVVS
jgi:beta-galactosidase